MGNLKKKLRFQLLKHITILFTKVPKFIIQIIKFYLFLHLPRLYKKETLALFLHKYSKEKEKITKIKIPTTKKNLKSFLYPLL